MRDTPSGSDLAVQARVTVNAAGPWVDTVRSLAGEIKGKQLHLTKGIHVVVPQQRLPISEIVVMHASDGRSTFAIPRGDIVYVGTTDTSYPQPVDRPKITGKDVEYLLAAVDWTFPDVRLRVEDVTGAWAGLRPLLHQEGKSPSEISRRDEIMVSPSGLISIAGGKLTTYRRMAERVVDRVGKVLKERFGRAFPGSNHTADHPLSGGDMGRGISFTDFCQRLEKEAVLYSLEEEMVMTVEDFLDRRTSASLFTPDNGLGVLAQVAHIIASHLGWDTERTQREIEAYRTLVQEMKAFVRG